METPYKQLHNLNQMTRRLLQELKEKELSVESIRRMIDEREKSVKELDQLPLPFRNSLSPGDRSALIALFDEFAMLNGQLREALQKALHLQQTHLVKTSKDRQAVKSYRKAAGKPDISFF